MKTRLFLLALTLFAIQVAHAQFPGGGFPGGNRGSHTSGGRPAGRPPSDGMERRPRAEESVADLVEYRLGILQEDLKLDIEQERTWMAFSDRVRAMAADVMREQTRPLLAGATALQQVNQSIDAARNRLTAMEDVAASMQKFYDSLTPQQRTLTDQRIATLLPLLQGRNQPMRTEGPPGTRPGGMSP